MYPSQSLPDNQLLPNYGYSSSEQALKYEQGKLPFFANNYMVSRENPSSSHRIISQCIQSIEER